MRPNTKPVALEIVASGFDLVGQSENINISGITHDSRQVIPGDIYVALPGANHHGIEFAAKAIENGAVAIATDQFGQEKITSQIPVIKLPNPRANMAVLAKSVYGNPDEKLKIVGVTGTNGKTSVTHILQSIFTNFGYKVGVIGTVGTYINGQHLSGVRTTPESTDLNAILAAMVQAEVSHVFMEVSSHALEMYRVSGINFEKSVFTNLSQDHLDYHGTMENYFSAKAKLFTSDFSKSAVIGIEDSWGKKLSLQTKIPVTTVGPGGNWEISDLHLTVTQTGFHLINKDQAFDCTLPMIGQFNATNAAMAVAVATELGLDPKLVCRELIKIHPVPGRSQIVAHNGQGTAIVDYAHTPEAVEKVLNTLREVCDGQLITVIGCGGDRDKTKRPLMGKISAQISDVVIVTDDNPRSEKPSEIRAQVLSGINQQDAKILEIGDRKEAIGQALKLASHSDVIAVLGKGHEQGQEINGVIHPFDDVEVIQKQAQNV